MQKLIQARSPRAARHGAASNALLWSLDAASRLPVEFDGHQHELLAALSLGRGGCGNGVCGVLNRAGECAVGSLREGKGGGDEVATNCAAAIRDDGREAYEDAPTWRGGELVLPQICSYLSPEDGDFLAWRTNRLVHGVAPFDRRRRATTEAATGVSTPLRTAFVFQTRAIHRGCLKCSD